jgi:putative inner membrane exporter YdcZ
MFPTAPFTIPALPGRHGAAHLWRTMTPPLSDQALLARLVAFDTAGQGYRLCVALRSFDRLEPHQSTTLKPAWGGALLSLFVLGQMLASVTFGHFGLFGLTVRAADLGRLLGAGPVVIGVL